MAFRIRMSVKVPKSLYDTNAALAAMKQTAHSKTIPDLQKMFRGTTEGWSEPPSFQGRTVIFSRSIRVVVEPKGPGTTNYIRVSKGTRPHTITARKRYGLLRFQSGYRSATRPGSLISHRPSRFGSFVTAFGVDHPGIKARDFDKLIAEEYQPTFERDMQEAIARGAK